MTNFEILWQFSWQLRYFSKVCENCLNIFDIFWEFFKLFWVKCIVWECLVTSYVFVEIFDKFWEFLLLFKYFWNYLTIFWVFVTIFNSIREKNKLSVKLAQFSSYRRLVQYTPELRIETKPKTGKNLYFYLNENRNENRNWT